MATDSARGLLEQFVLRGVTSSKDNAHNSRRLPLSPSVSKIQVAGEPSQRVQLTLFTSQDAPIRDLDPLDDIGPNTTSSITSTHCLPMLFTDQDVDSPTHDELQKIKIRAERLPGHGIQLGLELGRHMPCGRGHRHTAPRVPARASSGTTSPLMPILECF